MSTDKSLFRLAKGFSSVSTVAVQADIITPQAQEFVARLHRCFNGRRLQLLAARDVRQKQVGQEFQWQVQRMPAVPAEPPAAICTFQSSLAMSRGLQSGLWQARQVTSLTA